MLLRITFLTLCYSSLSHCQVITVNGLTPKPPKPSIDQASATESARHTVRTTLALSLIKQKWTLPTEDDEVSGCRCTCEVRKGKKPSSKVDDAMHQGYKSLVTNSEDRAPEIETSTIRFHFSGSATSPKDTTTQETTTVPTTTTVKTTTTTGTTEEPLAAIKNIVETTTTPSLAECTPETALHICKAFVLAVNHTGPLGSCILFNKDFLLRQFESCITNLCPRKLQACGSMRQIVEACEIVSLANSSWLSNKCTRENTCNEGAVRSRATSCHGTQSCFEVGPHTEKCASQAPAADASLVTGSRAVRRNQEVNWEPFGKGEDGRTNWEKWEQRYREIVGRSKNDKHD